MKIHVMKSWKKKRKWSSCSRSTCRMRVLFVPSIMSYWPNSVLPLTIAMSTVTVITGARTLLSIHNATIWMPWRDFAQLFHPIFDRQRCRGSVWIIDPWLAEMAKFPLAKFPGCPYPLIIRSEDFKSSCVVYTVTTTNTSTRTPSEIDSESIYTNKVHFEL